MLPRMGGAVSLVLPFAVAGSAALGLWLAGGALALTLPLRGTGDEWDELAGVMNGLLEEQRASIAREKAFSANAAHELRTPLTAMLGEVQVTLRRERSARVPRLARDHGGRGVAGGGARRRPAHACARGRRAARRRVGAVDLAEVVRSAVERARRGGRSRAPLLADPEVPAFAPVVDGAGPSPEVRARLFERFNEHAPGEGFGLGLAIAHALATAQRGALDLHAGAGSTAFQFELPVAGEPGSTGSDGPGAGAGERGPRHGE